MITKRQLELLSYINLIFNTRGEIPTYEEMKKMMKVKSKSTISNFIVSLVNQGYLIKNKLGKGNLTITNKGKITDKSFRLCPMCGHLVSKKYIKNVSDGEKYKMNKSQQESWLDRFEKGFADPLKYDDQLSIIKDSLLDFISTELQRILNEVEENLKFNQPKEFDTQTFRNYIAVEIDKLRKLNEK